MKLTIQQAANSYRFNELCRTIKMMGLFFPGWAADYANYEYRITFNRYSKRHHDCAYVAETGFRSIKQWREINRRLVAVCPICGKKDIYMFRTWVLGDGKWKWKLEMSPAFLEYKGKKIAGAKLDLKIDKNAPYGATTYFDDINIREMK